MRHRGVQCLSEALHGSELGEQIKVGGALVQGIQSLYCFASLTVSSRAQDRKSLFVCFACLNARVYSNASACVLNSAALEAAATVAVWLSGAVAPTKA